MWILYLKSFVLALRRDAPKHVPVDALVTAFVQRVENRCKSREDLLLK